MSVGPLGGLAASAAGSPLAQTKGSDVDQVQQDANSQQRRVESETKAEDAAGIGQTDGEDHEAADRDADGRRIWEKIAQDKHQEETPDPHQRPSKDASGQSGNLLDLSG
jgi:hypothetical protein